MAVLWAICAGLTIALRPLWIAGSGLLPRCPWHAVTGWPCPGCGSTRAIVHLLNGDALGALAHNPLVASGALLFVLGGLIAPAWLLCGGRAVSIGAGPGRRVRAAAAAVVLANWAWLAFAGV